MNGDCRKHILIVEDDMLLLQVIKKQFEDDGFTVELAADGEEALEKYYSGVFDAVVLDIIMPKKDGIKVLTEIQEKDPNTKTEFFILSTTNDMAAIALAVSNKAVAYLVKSHHNLETIRTAVEKKLCPRK